MIPPEGGGFRREANAQQASLSTLQKVVRYAEKDDLLLYTTAAFGVLMPGLMYFFYRYVHNRYQQNKRAQRQKKRQSKKDSRSATLFYCSDCPATREIAYDLAENLHLDPLVAKLGVQELEKVRYQKALHIFVLDANEGTSKLEPSHLSEFVDFLDEVRYERQEKNFLRGTRFLTLFTGAKEGAVGDHQQIIALERRLRSLAALPLEQPKSVDSYGDSLQELYAHLNDVLRRFNYGEFDSPDLANESTEESEYESE